VTPPYSLNVCAAAGLRAALADDVQLRWYVSQVLQSRELFYRFCDRKGFQYWPSGANFVLARVGEQAAGLTAYLERRGINRAGYFVMPMDETLAVVALDLGGRPHAAIDLRLKVVRVGDLQAELVHDFFEGFAIGARANVHAKVLYGRSSHHHIEAVFKAFARALRVACAKDKRMLKALPSTKGLI
jgi:hypothetical protein